MTKKIDPFYILLAIAAIGLFFYQKSNQPADISNQAAPPIEGVMLSGETLRLADYQGHYVLVDFWASWCGPCRRANPKVVRTYKKYKDQGLIVISVSLDRSAKAWKAAIEQDHLDWPTHILEVQGQPMPISDSYGVKSIPTKFLVDPQGVIIATNPSFRKIDRILSQKINKK